MNTKLLVEQSNDLVDVCYDFSLMEQRIFFLAVSKFNPAGAKVQQIELEGSRLVWRF